MANGYCNNLRPDVLNYAQNPSPYNNTNPIACRLCNQSFTSTQALLAHVESHMAHEEVAIRRLYSSPQHINPQMQFANSHHHFPTAQPIISDGRIFQAPTQPLAMPHQPRRNPFFNASQVGNSSEPMKQMQLPPQFLSFSGNHDDGTKAYIMQLEKPIKKIDFIDLVNVDDDHNSVFQILDLELKL